MKDATVCPALCDGGVWDAAEGDEVVVLLADEFGGERWDEIVEFLYGLWVL